MFSILNRALSWAITRFGNKFCLKKRSRLIKALDNRFYVKFMQLEIGLFHTQYCCHPFNPKLKPSTSQPTHFREVFRKSSHHVNTNKGSVVKQSGIDVEGCLSQKVLFQPNMRVFLQYSVIFLFCLKVKLHCF